MTAETPEVAQMSGPEHFRTAELYLRAIDGMPIDKALSMSTAAQAHATLALAAVTAELASHTAPPSLRTGRDDHGWRALLHPEDQASQRGPWIKED